MSSKTTVKIPVPTATHLCTTEGGDEAFRDTWAMRASSCSLPSRDSFLLMKSFSVALCCTLNSLHVSSIPLWSSFTSLSTFSRLTGGAEMGGRQEERGAGGQEGKEEEEEKEGGGGSRWGWSGLGGWLAALWLVDSSPAAALST